MIPIEITEKAVKLVARKISKDSGPGGMDSEPLQGWILKFWEDGKRLQTSVETLVNWLVNGSPPQAAYCAFMSGRLIALEKHPGVHPVGVGETRRRLFSKTVVNVTGPEANISWQDDQLYAILKAGINGLGPRSSSYFL